MIDLKDLVAATGGHLYGEVHADTFTELAFDSRLLEEPLFPQACGPLFVAVKSDTGDGHDYVVEAVRKGATGVLCQHGSITMPPQVTCILVDDTRQALLDWARFILSKYDTQVIAVTGSSGKTMTKEAIAAVLGTHYAVFKSYASYSGRYGLPIALGRLEPTHRVAVLELAADSIDEVRDLAQLTRPTIGVVTAVNEAHVENLGTIEAIEREKGRLVEALPADGKGAARRSTARRRHCRAQPGRRAGVAYAGADTGAHRELWPASRRGLHCWQRMPYGTRPTV
jgi:UDP-N-acetylmuramyl pentapeptide synthase